MAESHRITQLILAFGDAGKYWGKGCSLEKQSGAIYVGETQVGLIFNPSWSKSTIVVSETFARLPVVYMHPYAEALIDQLKPASLALLDTYPTPTYVSSEPIAIQDAPIRYLSTHQINPAISSSAERFAPPNLIHSTTSAALMSYVQSLPRTDLKATLLLLPFPRIPKPAPKVLGRSDFSHLSEDEFQWSETMMNNVQKLLFVAVEEKSGSSWHTPANSKPTGSRSAPVDGGMYI
ncbi:hypothetical protein BT96DRAFT_959032 [Gymnopus androsaceus JB14]|uniref:Uncharacterized protein n=1 Tax=Gymnopus androsaceus JB14 TaxID=1447944 RepID=A0A6A4H5W0_9AGAR|nr:hypothetical protein BT96DRAFT_959032 [Gymnopus androsaceus JB14]